MNNLINGQNRKYIVRN